MSQNNIHRTMDPSMTIGWALTVKPTSGQKINGFWLIHSGNGVNTQTYNNPTPVPASGVTLSQLLQSTGSKDGWTLVYMDGSGNLWTNGDWLQGSGSGLYDLPNDEGYTNCTITVTPSAPDSSGSVSVNISWSYVNSLQQLQTGNLRALTGYQNLNTLD